MPKRGEIVGVKRGGMEGHLGGNVTKRKKKRCVRGPKKERNFE